MVRLFDDYSDMPTLEQIHAANELDDACLPDLVIKNEKGENVPNPLYIVKSVYEHEGQVAMMCFLKVRSEAYFVVSHEVGTPEQRWEWLKEFKEYIVHEAYLHGLDQITAFIPPDIEESFGKRLWDLGFRKSTFVPYSLNIT
jgi:hypothetical protein